MDRARFDFAFDLAMVDHVDTTNLGEADAVIVGDGEPRLREGKGVIAVLATKTGIARRIPFSKTPKEGFHRQVNTNSNVLKNLGVNAFERGTLFFEYRERVNLPIARETFTSLLIGRLTHLKQVIIEPTTLFKGLIELLDLLLGWIDAILKVFMHGNSIAQKWQEVKREAAPPLPQTRNGLHPPSLKLGVFGLLKG
jgi:hypothetical protein